MAKRDFLVDLDLNKNQALNMKLQNLATAPTLAATDKGFIYWNTTDSKAYFWTGTEWRDVPLGTVLTIVNKTATDFVLNSSTGGGILIPAATITEAGLMSSSDKTKIDGIEAGADVTDSTNVDAAGAVMNADFTAQSILAAAVVGTPVALAIATNSVIGRVAGNIQNIAIDDDLSAVSAAADTVPSAKATKAYIDNALLTNGSLIYKGGYDASTNTPSLDAVTFLVGIKTGWTYVVTVNGTFFTETVQVGDMMIAKQNDPTLLAHWTLVNKNIPDIVAASTTAAGIVELADSTETIAQSDTTRAVTPQGLGALLAANYSSVTKRTVGTITGNGTLATFSITHALGVDCHVQVVEQSTGNYIDVALLITTTTVLVTFNTAPANLKVYRVIIIG
jgi:hypothetical protein